MTLITSRASCDAKKRPTTSATHWRRNNTPALSTTGFYKAINFPRPQTKLPPLLSDWMDNISLAHCAQHHLSGWNHLQDFSKTDFATRSAAPNAEQHLMGAIYACKERIGKRNERQLHCFFFFLVWMCVEWVELSCIDDVEVIQRNFCNTDILEWE